MKKLPGFTLIELLIVISVIGVLVSVLIIAIDPIKQLQRARDTRRKADIARIQQALELYRSDAGAYPVADQLRTCGPSVTLTYNSINYLDSIPCDPKGSGIPYTYAPTGTPPTTYSIKVCLENNKDIDGVTDVTLCGSSGKAYSKTNP